MNNTKKNPRVYLEDILGAIDWISQYTADGKDLFFRDPKTQDAVIRQISIVGEASAKLPHSLKEAEPAIPWKKIIGMRNIIVHDYSHTDLIIVWDTIEKHLPVLKIAVKKMLEAIP